MNNLGRFIFGIIKFCLVTFGFGAALLAALYFFGNLKYIEPHKLEFSDNRILQLQTPETWCGISAALYKLANFTPPKNEMFIKNKGCAVKDLLTPPEIADLVKLQAKKISEASQEGEMLRICAQHNSYGITGSINNGALYCESEERDGFKSITAFKLMEKDYLAITAMIIPKDENYAIQKQNLTKLVDSYVLK